MIKQEKLIKCLKNKNSMNIVRKVLNYNFKDTSKTESLISIINQYLIDKTISLKDVHKHVKENDLYITDDNENERVLRKVHDLTNIIYSDSFKTNKIQSILDIGVGNGNILTKLGQEIGLNKENLYGVDTVDYTQSVEFNHIQYVNNTIPIKSDSIDLITIMMVLHHTDDPIETLKEAYKAISDSGTIIIRETNAYNEDILEFNIIMEYIFYTILFDIPVSITENYLSCNDWEKLFKKVGFKFKKIIENKLDNDPFTSVYYTLQK